MIRRGEGWGSVFSSPYLPKSQKMLQIFALVRETKRFMTPLFAAQKCFLAHASFIESGSAAWDALSYFR